MSFNLVLDEPVEGDVVEEHGGLQFTVEPKLYNDFGPFTLSSTKQGSQVYLQLIPAKQPAQGGGGGCDSCSSCG